MTQLTSKTLYDSDFALWIEETISKLKAQEFERVDWENLIEEVESLGKRDKRELKSRLITLFEHLLKRIYVPLPDCYRGWEVTIRRTQSKLKDILADSPSLSGFLASIYFDCYQEAVDNMQIEYDAYFPDLCPFPQDVTVLLTEKLWEKSQ
ncbi:DUF29 domain-containing protein [Pleurocapsa sp. FMAR1]|uniref:DUF29 domain-containing protein n=1 Tax=Pleurocapsa sp. FMAR1 TaxID=3040204 RepID=UPI0029C83027|nr:DUF29 domain-containing protein [Pleurocapsa sp. FMAR1]